MLKLLARNLDICKVSKLLGSYRLRASITDSTIIIDSEEVADEVIDHLFELVTVISAQNYYGSEEVLSEETSSEDNQEIALEDDATTVVESENQSMTYAEESVIAFDDETIDSEYYVEEDSSTIEEKEGKREKVIFGQIPESELIYRGDVFEWGMIRDEEDGEGKIKECVIIIQNDYYRSTSEDTIALFCTSHFEERAPIHFSFQLEEGTMTNFESSLVGPYKYTTMFVGHIKGIRRNQLGRYLGSMNYSFMNTLQPTIDFCLGLKRSRNVNWAQLEMLSTINMGNLLEISESTMNISGKVTKFLELFRFDMAKHGVEYVKQAIIAANTMQNYRLEDLAQSVAQKEKIEAKEVLRLIVARIKENFQFKRSPAISFIRLIDRLLKKG